ncbi:C6 finger domain protein [Mollisia scopiformis]|uniref:C6 finger domain protein n=1 Tax=Mollisia scopiformis TaxID=149040 RepID=A0A194XV46_MOLSC|nr:C6 finger domain protein [Mollisia scopiformis]KUJ24011.1 C6 finger domain protein [Mollisia scopiformis]
MNKRNFREAFGFARNEGLEIGSSPFDNSVDHPSAAAEDNGTKSSSSRTFIALQACEACRAKKTRCDEGKPCGLCQSLGIECQYKERKATKKEISSAMLMNGLRRVETRLESLSQQVSGITSSLAFQTSPRTEDVVDTNLLLSTDNSKAAVAHSPSESRLRPALSSMDDLNQDIDVLETPASASRTAISFSQHHVLFWPAINTQITTAVPSLLSSLQKEYASDLEMERDKLTMATNPYPLGVGDAWLDKLPYSIITALSEVYFATFNLMSPLLDQDAYIYDTLPTILRGGFGHDMYSCVVLNVLALGCMSVKGYQEGGFPLPAGHGRQSNATEISFESPEWVGIIGEEYPGLSFFNEARKRIGASLCENDLQSCQFYLLSGIYLMQLVRPTDGWAMFSRACVCCLTMLKSDQTDRGDWEADMQCRVFWTTLMFETILIQELNLPNSGLRQFENDVPIPKFSPFPHRGRHGARAAERVENDTFFQFHFLAQVAHRILLSRIRQTLFFYSPSEENFPPTSLVSELYHQLEQWRDSLPESIRIDESATPSVPKTPMHAFVPAILYTRYKVAKFHLGRPFLYKALHNPSSLGDDDLQACHSSLIAGMDWPHTSDICRDMPSLQPLKFATCSQYFGQLLVYWGIKRSPDSRVREVVPEGYERWASEMMGFLRECAPHSMTVSRDVEIIEALGFGKSLKL